VTLYGAFEATFRRLPDKVALRTLEDECWTYSALEQEASRYCNALLALGLEPGDRVSVQIDKSPANLFLYLGTLKAGGVYQPLNPAYTETEVDYFVSDANPRILVCAPERQTAMRALADRHGVNAVVNLDGAGLGSLAGLAARMESRQDTEPRQADDLAALVYTSGTTGRAKGAMISHGNLLSNAKTLVDVWRITEADTLLHALPVFHVHGLFVAINTMLLAGAEMLWFSKFDAVQVAASLKQATVLMGVPTFYTRLLGLPAFDCTRMRLFISGSAPLLASTHLEFAGRTGHRILERYGMTETGMLTSNPYDGERVAGTVGFPLPGVDLRLKDGVIEVKGPNVFKGYWKREIQDFTADGYFVTGDMGTVDGEGRVSIVGRAKDLIISGGFNVYPKEIEAAIDAVPGVVESAVIGVPHPDFGEGVVAVFTGTAKPETILQEVSITLAKFKQPKRVVAVPELPRNAMGKVQKAELRKAYAGIFA
jgi:malonyl-CoA/methylmalonyl-CoA synthetase